MDCNKDEAIRAKELAEEMMQTKDFTGARKFALKAQQLCSDLENISQILMVCDVHSAAEKKILNEVDWYGILQVEQSADEATIKKQYKKFALLLHPDKNAFPGADAAFKLVGEAQCVLLNQNKRSAFDMKRRATVGKSVSSSIYRSVLKRTWHPYPDVNNNVFSNFKSVNLRPPPSNEGSFKGPAFSTKCPYCSAKYQYGMDVLQKALRCKTCNKTYVAYAEPTSMNQSSYSQQSESQNQGASTMEEGHQGNSRAGDSKMPFSSKGSRGSNTGVLKVDSVKRKRSGDSSECAGTEEGNINAECHKKGTSQRSVRLKQQDSDKRNCNNDEEATSCSKKVKGRSPVATKLGDDTGRKDAHRTKKQTEEEKCASLRKRAPDKTMETQKKSDKEKAYECDSEETDQTAGEFSDIDTSLDSSTMSEEDRELYVCPQSEFHDFDKNKKEKCFSAGQIWAVYDTLDAMPRFYAWVRNVVFPGFKLKITWLDPDPKNMDEIEWVDEGLPVSCGRFIIGDTEDSNDRFMFSHLICLEKWKSRKSFKIYPRKGETWALFKNWDIKWKQDAETDMKFEFEYVEILSEFVEGEGINVAHLGKLKNFVSVFCRTVKEGVDAFQVHPNELFRFSHQIPSHVLTGEEREGVPKGSFELDPASLPANIEEITVQEILKTKAANGTLNVSCSSSEKLNSTTQLRESSAVNQDEVKEADSSPYLNPTMRPRECSPVNADEILKTTVVEISKLVAATGNINDSCSSSKELDPAMQSRGNLPVNPDEVEESGHVPDLSPKLPSRGSSPVNADEARETDCHVENSNPKTQSRESSATDRDEEEVAVNSPMDHDEGKEGGHVPDTNPITQSRESSSINQNEAKESCNHHHDDNDCDWTCRLF